MKNLKSAFNANIQFCLKMIRKLLGLEKEFDDDG